MVKIATMIVGVMAAMPKSSTMRACSRAPARPRRRWIQRVTSRRARNDAQQQQDDQIDEKQDDRRPALALGIAEAAGQHAIGGEARGDGGDEQGHGQLALEADAPRPCHLAAHELPRPIR